MAKLLNNRAIVFFLLMPFFKPVCFQYYSNLSVVEELFVLWKIVSAVIIIILLLLYMWKIKRIPKIIIPVTIFEMYILLSTIYNQGDVARALIDMVSIVAYVTVLILIMYYNLSGLLRVLYNITSVLMIINLITIIIFPNGLHADLYTNEKNPLYFMVVDNGNTLFLSFCIMIFMLRGITEHNMGSYKNIFLLSVGILSAILSGSATATLLICVEVALVIFTLKTKRMLIQEPKVLLSLYIAFVVVLFTMNDNALIGYILENFFNRSADISGRSFLWTLALELIEQKPILGYGRQAGDYIVAWGSTFSSHNFILEMLLQGGIIAVILFVAIIIFTIRNANKMKKSKLTICLVTTLLIMLIAVSVEAVIHSVYIFGGIVFTYYCRTLEMKTTELKKCI